MFPALFVSHGAPTLPFENVPARQFLIDLGRDLPRPRRIVIISAHWETATPQITAATRNSTIHDFYGFPKALYDLRYEPPGDPAAAADLAKHLAAAGFAASLDAVRGLDHGAWVPLMLMYPQADIPVLQLSIQPQLGVAHHLALGQALRSLRGDTLILASGGYVHNLRALDWHGGAEPDWSARFAAAMDEALMVRRDDTLIGYRSQLPESVRAHPSEDHILPLFVAYGAGETTRRLHASATYGSLRMDAYAFD